MRGAASLVRGIRAEKLAGVWRAPLWGAGVSQVAVVMAVAVVAEMMMEPVFRVRVPLVISRVSGRATGKAAVTIPPRLPEVLPICRRLFLARRAVAVSVAMGRSVVVTRY